MGPKTDDRANKGSTNLIRCYRTDDLVIMEAYIRQVLGMRNLIFLNKLTTQCLEMFSVFPVKHTMDQKMNDLHRRPKTEDEGSYK